MTRIKICGITSPADAEAAIECGADYIGIVQEPTSKRYVENPVEIVQVCVAKAVAIGVFGLQIDKTYIQVFDSIQSLSSETPSNGLRSFRVGETTVEKIVLEATGPILLDSYEPGAFGGTGVTCDWDAAADVVAMCPHPVFLAGGLTPDNVAEAIAKVRPYAVDVSSGVEASPGSKDHGKVRAFIQAASSV